MTQTIVETISPAEIRERMRGEMEPDTFQHAERTVEVARQLAIAHGEDPDRAEVAALVHDIADRFSDRELLRLADYYDIPSQPDGGQDSEAAPCQSRRGDAAGVGRPR